MHSEKVAQLRAETAGIAPQASTALSEKSPILRAFSDAFIAAQPYLMPGAGVEPARPKTVTGF